MGRSVEFPSLPNNKAALPFTVELCRVGELLFRGATLDPELSPRGELEY